MDRDVAHESAMEAVKLAPTLVPAAVLAAKFESEAHQVRRAMKLVEAAWLANPHPDLADAYAHVKLGDTAWHRLQRVETPPRRLRRQARSFRGQLAIARAAIEASEFARAREVLAPYLKDPTQRVALLMAELERSEHGDGGRARAWTLRAVRARLDPAWTADGYVSDRWRPVSRSPAASMRSSGRLRSRACPRTGAPRSNPRPSRRPCWPLRRRSGWPPFPARLRWNRR